MCVYNGMLILAFVCTQHTFYRNIDSFHDMCFTFLWKGNENEFLVAQKDKLIVGWDARHNAIIQRYDEHLSSVNTGLPLCVRVRVCCVCVCA